MALLTVDEAKLQLGKGTSVDNAELQSYVDAVTDVIEDYCGAIEQVTVDETHWNVTGDTIVLRSERVVSVESVTSYAGTSGTAYTAVGSPVDGTDTTFLVDTGAGLLRRSSGHWTGQTVVVSYTAGMASVPPAVNLAARLLMQDLWQSQQGGAGLPPVFEDDSVTAGGEQLPQGRRAMELLQRYRRAPRVA